MQNGPPYSIFCFENGNIIIIVRGRLIFCFVCRVGIIFLLWINQTGNLDPPLLCAIRASCMPV